MPAGTWWGSVGCNFQAAGVAMWSCLRSILIQRGALRATFQGLVDHLVPVVGGAGQHDVDLAQDLVRQCDDGLLVALAAGPVAGICP